ncbi:MAG: GNAT family N-acetyltransferase [Ignavibacteria bacterium]
MMINEKVFDEFPVIETERLKLREITTDDRNEIFEIYSSEEAMKYFGKIPYKKIEEADERIMITQKAFKEKEGIRWGITLKPSGKLIGSAGIWRIDNIHFRGEVGYELSPQHWRKGIMYEALLPILSFGFEKINLHTIEANTDPENTSSRKLLHKLGFEQEGYFKENFYFDGKFLDTVSYSLISKNQIYDPDI